MSTPGSRSLVGHFRILPAHQQIVQKMKTRENQIEKLQQNLVLRIRFGWRETCPNFEGKFGFLISLLMLYNEKLVQCKHQLT